MNEPQNHNAKEVPNPLIKEVRSTLSEDREVTAAKVQELVNLERSGEGSFRFIRGLIRGTSLKRVQAVLDLLEGDPAERIIKETRYEGSKMNFIKGGEATRIDRDYYRLEKSRDQSA